MIIPQVSMSPLEIYRYIIIGGSGIRLFLGAILLLFGSKEMYLNHSEGGCVDKCYTDPTYGYTWCD